MEKDIMANFMLKSIDVFVDFAIKNNILARIVILEWYFRMNALR